MVKTRLCTGGMVWKATTSKEEAIRRWSGGPASRTPHSIRPEVPVLRKAGLVGRSRREYRHQETARPLPESPLAKRKSFSLPPLPCQGAGNERPGALRPSEGGRWEG